MWWWSRREINACGSFAKVFLSILIIASGLFLIGCWLASGRFLVGWAWPGPARPGRPEIQSTSGFLMVLLWVSLVFL